MEASYYPESYYRGYDDIETVVLPDNSLLLVDRDGAEGTICHYWLTLPNGATVAFLSADFRPDAEEEKLVLNSIEVRGPYRGMGLAAELIKAVENYWGEKMYSRGRFTPEGYKRLARGARFQAGVEPRIAFHSMTFIEDWNLLLPLVH